MSSDSPSSHTFISQRLRLHYVDWGNPSAPPLVLVHGGEDHCRNWDGVAQALRKDWHVIAPDLRGHGESEWASDGTYFIAGLIYDLAELVRHLNLAPVTIIGHSYGGHIALRYAGLYPDEVRKLVAIEGLGPSPQRMAEEMKITAADRMRRWIDERRKMVDRPARTYATVADATARMQANNKRLTPELARHLTEHGVRKNDDGTFSWKFDPALRAWPPYDVTREAIANLWERITCPTLLVYGNESWASNPAEDGRAKHFKNAEVAVIDGAGHWVHHDQRDAFLKLIRGFV